MKKSTIIAVVLLLFVQIAFSQGASNVQLRGTIKTASDFVNEVNVVNETTKTTTSSNELGQFTITAKEGDLLVFTAVNLVTVNKKISKQDILSGFINVLANLQTIPLKEVVIKKSSISAENLGVISANQKKYTAAERKLYTATSGGGIDGLLNAISGRKAMLKKEIIVESKESAFNRLIYLFEDDYYTVKLKIPADYIKGFQFYCVEDSEFVIAVKSKNNTLIKFLMINLAAKYNKLNNVEISN
ncbi:hypothetical protein [Flavobacterium sp. 7A]|uniref:hypothetical protein n=1 Tax=Flavobacterium sp. 7A TaxID=2940571 RepID=UPI002225C645|nr:hypothetical protein [Flavobacterium sp. 7A]MCW2119170.1 hypothetical protein [Flavobacterium sp. 7A]